VPKARKAQPLLGRVHLDAGFFTGLKFQWSMIKDSHWAEPLLTREAA
jgi:hypothetical protein